MYVEADSHANEDSANGNRTTDVASIHKMTAGP